MSDSAQARRKPWYFATPYTVRHEDGSRCDHEQEVNFRRACRNAYALVAAGYCVFCPIAHSHPIHYAGPGFVGGRVQHDDWYAQDNDIIAATDWAGLILAPGWQRSQGCLAEWTLFLERELPILTLEEALEGKHD